MSGGKLTQFELGSLHEVLTKVVVGLHESARNCQDPVTDSGRALQERRRR